MRMGQGVRTGLGHGGITCVLQTQFSSLHKGTWCISEACNIKVYDRSLQLVKQGIAFDLKYNILFIMKHILNELRQTK